MFTLWFVWSLKLTKHLKEIKEEAIPSLLKAYNLNVDKTALALPPELFSQVCDKSRSREGTAV